MINNFHIYILSIFFLQSVNLNLFGQAVDTVKSKDKYVKYIMSVSGKEKNPNFFKKLNNIVFGENLNVLQKPMSILKRKSGRLWITDIGNQQILLIKDGRIKTEKYLKKFMYQLKSPVGIAAVTENSFLLSDSYSGEVYLIDEKEKKVQIFKTGLNQPTGIAYCSVSKQIYVVETNAHRISVFNKNGELLRTIGKRGISPGEFNYPTFIWTDKLGIIYVIDSLNFRIQIFDQEGKLIRVFGTQGSGTGNFARPKGIATDSEGNIYISDALFHAVQIFDQKGNFLYTFGTQGRGEGQFWMPAGIFIDENDYIYVADSYNSRIQVFKVFEKDE